MKKASEKSLTNPLGQNQQADFDEIAAMEQA